MIRVARSQQQERDLRALLRGEKVHLPSYGLRGRAKLYAGRYDAAFWNFVERIQCAGYSIIHTLGPRGGIYSSTVRIGYDVYFDDESGFTYPAPCVPEKLRRITEISQYEKRSARRS